MQKKILNAVAILWQTSLLILVFNVFINPGLWIYLLRQAKGQLTVIAQTRDVTPLLQSSALSETQKYKIRLIQEVKLYAETRLGLKKTNNYSTYFDHGKQPVIWLLTACEPFSLKEKTWTFPMLGEVSYKGFFDYNLGLKEANELRVESFDVDLGRVSAWSTLGILSDPILSSMLDDSEGELAELIIHELTHATLYLPSSVDFNENFASFVGRKGAISFLEQKYGVQNDTLKSYLKNLEEEDTIKAFVLKHKQILAQFYNTLDDKLTVVQKNRLKADELNKIITALHLLPLSNKLKLKMAKRIVVSKNAFFMHYNRYDAQYEQLNQIFEQEGKLLPAFINSAKNNGFKRLINDTDEH